MNIDRYFIMIIGVHIKIEERILGGHNDESYVIEYDEFEKCFLFLLFFSNFFDHHGYKILFFIKNNKRQQIINSIVFNHLAVIPLNLKCS